MMKERKENWESASGAASDEGSGDVEDDLRSVSFGALLSAQSTLASPASSSKRKSQPSSEGTRRQQDQTVSVDDSARSLSGSKDSLMGKREKPKRDGSKHAPMEMSSKKPVSRHRDVIEVPKSKSRDPRFDSLSSSQASSDMRRIREKYAFLDDYREDEMKMMREELKKEKDESRKLQIEKKLQSMESRKLAQKKKDEEQDWLRKHKNQEREAVKQGKKPYYLKKSEAKRLMLSETFQNLGEKQRDRVLEKKRRKQASKEKKNLPFSRRSFS